jgi:hypothetical protein
LAVNIATGVGALLWGIRLTRVVLRATKGDQFSLLYAGVQALLAPDPVAVFSLQAHRLNEREVNFVNVFSIGHIWKVVIIGGEK